MGLIVQGALTTLFGIGVLTLATIALLNVACIRLHDVQKRDGNRKRRFAYAYVYDGQKAHEARAGLRNLPSFLGWTGFLMIAMVQLFHIVAYSTNEESAALLDIITWMSIASYVLALLGVAALVSRRIYHAMAEVNLA